MKIVLEGELHIKEPSSGTSIVAKVGDVLNISNGAALEFNSTDKARIFVSDWEPAERERSDRLIESASTPSIIQYVAKRAKLE